ncbi:MarR family transcriptional regulator [Azospirillum sp. SYSU D00513]|uniref:MarR family winged helix-turn-helix transcriptional regulator n=1 Tax=Azospirillum sp. SYSU D00513 TaxID=2812561 RepID=UPI001A96D9F8|nr:MarR family transcriptional regulator [Azospirillum sp. SYSU D00513]
MMYALCMHDERLLANKVGALWATLSGAVEDAFAPLSNSSAAALLTLLHWGPTAATALGAVIGLSQPATARLLEKLAADGHVERRPRPRGGKEVPFALTESGRERAEALQQGRLDACLRLLAPLDPGQRALLDGLLTAMLAAPVADQTPVRAYARHVCRFCDHGVCDGPLCPIGSAAREAERTTPPCSPPTGKGRRP